MNVAELWVLIVVLAVVACILAWQLRITTNLLEERTRQTFALRKQILSLRLFLANEGLTIKYKQELNDYESHDS